MDNALYYVNGEYDKVRSIRNGHAHVRGNKRASTKTKVKKQSINRPTKDHPPF